MLKRHAELLEEFRLALFFGQVVQRLSLGAYVALYYPTNIGKVVLDLRDNPAPSKVRLSRIIKR